MKIVSIGLYNPIPVTSGSDSYINFILHPLSQNHDVTHFYFYKGYHDREAKDTSKPFRTRYLLSPPFFNFQKMPPFMGLLRPDLYLSRSPLKQIRSDVILCDTFTFSAAEYLARRNNSPMIMIKHNIEWQYVKNDGSKLYMLLKPYEDYTNRKSDVIITLSKNDYRYMMQRYHHKKIFYVPPQVNTRLFKPLGPAYPFKKDKLNILFYGSLDRPMNITALEFIKHRLIPLLEQRHLLSSVRINIFGSGTPPESLSIKQDENINYLGMVKDPGYYIRGADVVIVPLKNNGGLKIRLLESLSCGKPVIATQEAVDGLSERLRKMVIIRNDAQGFADAIQDFIKKPKKKNFVKRNTQFYNAQMTGTSMNYIIQTAVNRNT